MVFSHLHGYRKVCLRLGGEKHIDCFLNEWLVSCSWLTHFNDVQLSAETGQVRLLRYTSTVPTLTSKTAYTQLCLILTTTKKSACL